MRGRVSWLRIITFANVVVAALVILVLYGTMLALSVLAPEISSWQLLTLLAIGVPISVVGLRLTTNLDSRRWRWLGLTVNGAAIAQDWLNLDSERAPSNFDQRHLVTAQFQYTTGVGMGGGALLDGATGTLFKGLAMASAGLLGLLLLYRNASHA